MATGLESQLGRMLCGLGAGHLEAMAGRLERFIREIGENTSCGQTESLLFSAFLEMELFPLFKLFRHTRDEDGREDYYI